MSVVSFRQSAAASDSSGNATSLAIGYAGTLTNSLLLLTVNIGASAAGEQVPSTPAGWTPLSVGSNSVGNNGFSGTTFYRVAGAGESSVTVSWGTAAPVLLTVQEYAGVDPTNPVRNSGSDSTAVPDFTNYSAKAGDLLWAAAWRTGGSSPSASGMTTRQTAGPTTAGLYEAVFDQSNPPGPTGRRPVSLGGSNGMLVHSAILARLETAPSAPGAFTSPTAGQVVGNSVVASWGAASDAEGDTLTYGLDLSTNGGGSWTRVYTGGGTSVTVDVSGFPASPNCLFRVYANDGTVQGPTTTSPAFTIFRNSAPTAPTLRTPNNGTYVDLAAGSTFTWTFSDPDVGDTQAAYAFRRKAAGAGAYDYWNASTQAFQASEVFNGGSAATVTFPAAKWTNGTTYNWSVSTRDPAGATGPYAGDFTVVANSAPTVTVTAPTGTVTTTSKPVVTWTYADAQGDPQENYQVRVFTAAQYGAAGFDPGTSAAFLDSGVMLSASTRSYTPTTGLDNSTTYRAYVRVGQTGSLFSSWQFSQFSLSLTVPNTPTLLASDEPAAARVRLTATATYGGAYTRTNTSLVIEFRDTATASWTTVRGAGALAADTNGQATVFDYEAPPGLTRSYRARTVGNI